MSQIVQEEKVLSFKINSNFICLAKKVLTQMCQRCEHVPIPVYLLVISEHLQNHFDIRN